MNGEDTKRHFTLDLML